MSRHCDTVLVIDDDPAALRMVTSRLESARINALAATSGEAALQVLRNITPDLIIIDAAMPGIDGFETTSRIKRDHRLADIPVMFLTGLTGSDQAVRAFDAGGVDYVRKPVNLNELLARVRSHIALARAVQASAACLDAAERLMLAIGPDGVVHWCTPKAAAAIARAMPGWSRRHATLPADLLEPVQHLLAGGQRSAGTSAGHSVRAAGLELLLVGRPRAGGALFRISPIDSARDTDRLQQMLGLTRREAEVLSWVSLGKSNAHIAGQLAISPRTVQKHLEHVYAKLGVETRSAAAAVAVRISQ